MSIGSSKAADTSHLKYYRSQDISPVRYEMRTLAEHFDRRDSLYRTLGLPPTAFKGVSVLEVAPGSGQNSLYVAYSMPRSLDLVEPNPRALKEITALYRDHEGRAAAPRLHAVEFEAFNPGRSFDVVLCENWLGSLPNELALIRKLVSLVAPGGTLVLTIVPYSGFFPNVLRRLLALRALRPELSFAERTSLMVEAFGPHLATITNMTRSHEHWVQDCVINPHYLNVALSLVTLLAEIGEEMEVLGTSPRFTTEWRWFKGLVGQERQFNAAFCRSYRENIHNFIDYRRLYEPRAATENDAIEEHCRKLHEAALAWERRSVQDRTTAIDETDGILASIRSLASELDRIDPSWGRALAEVGELWVKPNIGPHDIGNMRDFAPLFGRETIYVSLTKRSPWNDSQTQRGP